MSSSKDLARDITHPDAVTSRPRHCHVSPKGLVHDGRLGDCTWCRVLTDGDTHTAAQIAEYRRNTDDTALDRCGRDEPGETSGIRASPFAAPSNPWPRVAEIEAAQHPAIPLLAFMTWCAVAGSSVLALVVIAVQVARWIR